MLTIEQIIEIRKSKLHDRGYEIVFPEDKIIWLTKRRTIAGLLILIKYHTASEADLVGANNRLQTIKKILNGKIDSSWIQDRYGDANKPFSELWTEEGFSVVHAEGLQGNRQYVLDPEDHEKLFNINAKSSRLQLSVQDKNNILRLQGGKCNFCGSYLFTKNSINKYTFSKDRVTLEFDHRIPIDRGGENIFENYQALCHYCNKSKRQMCFVCTETCSDSCALVNPSNSHIVLATGEDISDRLTN
ncbi:HNH endonuclease [Pilibacter termitis]|uniref:HNH endonuclease n=1 Tax=Pilibacter termitis TaxID=263852 RepID=A0A1T4PS60_9ENTE|nr:HNH endonuclease signature motif containing protein [Pilibacter termitis]SJZ94474.1 HNH endonuclease [Pilibacter termitis]